MDQLTKEQYIAHLMSAPWQDIKEEAELHGVEKSADDKWKDLIPAIADKKFADPVVESSEELTEEDKDFLEPELVEDLEEEVAIESIIQPEEPKDEVLRFDYVRKGVTIHCQHCDYEIRVGFDGEKICPVSHPKCPRPSPNEVK
jgi:hypothetical protein